MIRAGDRDNRDPLFTVLFDYQALTSKVTATRRVGRPKHKLHVTTLQTAWEAMPTKISANQDCTGSVEQRLKIQNKRD